MQKSMGVSIFAVFHRNYPFWENLVPKLKIVSLSWNLELRLIRMCRIRWWFSFYSFLDWKYLFKVNLVQKSKIASLSWHLVLRLFRICKIWWWYFFSILDLFLHSLSKKSVWNFINFISLSSLFAGTWSQWLFLLELWNHDCFLGHLLSFIVGLDEMGPLYWTNPKYISIWF